MQAFARALSLSDTAPIEGDISPSSPRSPPVGLDRQHRWNHGPDHAAFGGSHGGLGDNGAGGRVEKLTATSDFAVSNVLLGDHVSHADQKPIHQKVSR